MIKTFSPEVKLAISGSQNGYCKNCLNPIDKVNGFHHMLINSKSNRAKFPFFLHSPMNCVGLCFHCHTHKKHLFRIKPELASVYEEFLQELEYDVPF